MGQHNAKESKGDPDRYKVYNSPHNQGNEENRFSARSYRNLQDGNFHRFEDPDLNPDDDVDKNSPTNSLLAHPAALDVRQSNYGSIQGNTPREEVPSDGILHSSRANNSLEKLPFLMINITVLLMNASGHFHNPVMSQYLYQKFADSLLGNASRKTSSHPCLNDSSADPTTAASVRKVQQMTSEMLLYLNLSNYCTAIPVCLLLGALANTLSRKQLLIIPVLGYLAKSVTIAVVICWHLNINWFFLGYAAEGILGNLSGFFFGAFLYTSDITSRDKIRTVGVSIVEGLKGLFLAGLNSVTGHLIQRTGYVAPALMSTGCVALSIVVVLLLPNRKPQLHFDRSDDYTGPLIRWCKRLTAPFSTASGNQVRKLAITGVFAFLLALVANVGVSKVETLYIMNMPFCFDAVTQGWYMFGREMAYNGFLIIAIPLLYNCMPGMWLGILGALSAILGNIMYAVATTDVEIYHIILLSIGQALPVSMIRGETSRLFDSEAQGPLFAIFATLECIGYAMGTTALSVYRTSLSVYKGLVFIMFALAMAVVAIMLFVYQIFWKRHTLENLVKELRLKSAEITNP